MFFMIKIYLDSTICNTKINDLFNQLALIFYLKWMMLHCMQLE